MVDHVAALTLAQVRVLQKDAQAICSVSQDDQREQEVRNSLCRLPLELWGKTIQQKREVRKMLCLFIYFYLKRNG